MGAVLVVAAALAVLSLIPALAARRDLQAGADQLTRARSLLSAGQVASAERAFSSAQDSFEKARSEAGNPLLRAEGFVPLLGRTPRALGTLALVGDEIARAGGHLTSTLTTLPGGVSSLLPTNERFSLSSYRTLEPVLAESVTVLREASRKVGLVPRSFVLPQVRHAAELARSEIGRALSLARPAQAMLHVIPRFAGAGSSRRYLVGLLNPDELRGPGGFMGLYSVATFRDGRVSIGHFVGDALRDLAPGPEWGTIAFDPDLPTVGRLLVRVWNRSLHPHIDGVIFLDPQFFPPLLRAIGDIPAPRIRFTVTPGNTVDFTTNRAYFLYRSRTARKAALASIASEALDRFLHSPPSFSALSDIVRTAADGYIHVYSVDPAVERAFRLSHVTGDYGPGRPGTDFFGVAFVNQAANKVDYYVRRSIRYDVSLGAGGTASAGVHVTFRNGAPTGRPPSEVFSTGTWGGGPKHLVPGDDYGTVRFFCGSECTLTSARLQAHDAPLQPSREGSSTTHGYDGVLLVRPQQSRTFALDLLTAHAWSGGGGGGIYHLHLQDQPLIRPTVVTVVIRVPPGMRIVSVDPSMHTAGDEAIWRGVLQTAQDLEIRFEPA